MHTHHDHSRRVIITIGFAATLLAVVTSPHDHSPLSSHQPPVQVASH
jgi:hypothetical protein